ncbi:hypothetical protein DKT68_21435 [Micromonospora acroterricola]|uniref:DUF11 domain-containing protein n=1 Tax=Micromonospora acroterricola TaxID=2202421 RepID=A0A317CY49_9ACTN|nr:hypothetical protein [Micromonospora acroterricola]PWR06770.1 hypothetical protein DKT68_21435 [Micromonospora acroterricola]
MSSVHLSPGPRAARRRPTPLLAVSLALGLLAALAVAPAWAGAATPDASPVAAATDPMADPEPGPETTPAEEPTPTEEPGGDPLPTEPAPETTAPPPETTPPAPQTTAPEVPPAPTTTAPVPGSTTRPPTAGPPAPTMPPVPPVRPPAPGPDAPPPNPLGVQVTTEDVTLTGAYWNAASTAATLRVTVTNTGTTAQRIRLSYTLPAGLTDAGTRGCAATGGGAYRCGAWTAQAGARFSSLLRLRVSGAAWKRMPLSGSVRVLATAPGVAGEAADDQGFAVLFPPGPPVPGISLAADEVSFDISGAASTLAVRLGNTGTVDAVGRVEVVLPAGVSVPTPPAGCVAVDQTRTRCDAGAVPAGRTAELRLPVEATAQAQREAPLSGAVIGQLDPRSGPTRQVQMSFRITAAAALATPVVSPPAPTGSQGVLAAGGAADDGGMTSVHRTAVLLIAVSALLVVLALTLATTSLRRRLSDAGSEPTTVPTD